ncbi:MAG: twin-arginine translocase TatA/TatE family subunit [Acidobacteriota bacterium]|nr:twin-arginine translocase TatA/TatE family subunit [Acidobacteriota bacterium]
MLAVINDTGILVVLVAVVLLFGASRIPKLARNLGEASREFKHAQDDALTTTQPTALPVPETVTMTRSELDALLASRNAAVVQPGTARSVS